MFVNFFVTNETYELYKEKEQFIFFDYVQTSEATFSPGSLTDFHSDDG